MLYGIKEYLPPVPDVEDVKWFAAGYGEAADLIAELKADKKMGFRGFQGAWLTDLPVDEDCPALAKNLDPYTIVVDDDLEEEEKTSAVEYLFKTKQVRYVHFESNNQGWLAACLAGKLAARLTFPQQWRLTPYLRGERNLMALKASA